MVDIHCHILPGIDDGAADLSAAERMLDAAAADGIDTIVCTPHHSEKACREADNLRSALEEHAASAGIRLFPGMEYYYSHFQTDAGELRPLGGSSFLLVDLSCTTLPPSIGKLFFTLERRGYQIIIAHPERFLLNQDACAELFRLGAFFQLNADSILGRNGSRCRRTAERMIRNGYCHFVASDAHGRSHRTFHLSECRRFLADNYGEEFAGLVMERNPGRLLENLPPEQMLPERRGGWLRRFFRR